MNKIKGIMAVLCVATALWASSRAAQAVDIEKGLFDSKTRYDIYLQGSENNYTIIVSVEIVRVEEIFGRRFLVVRPADFTLNSADGFVAFDAIQAILPSRQIKVRHGEKIEVSY